MIQNPLHIYVDTESQKSIIEEKAKGIYQLKKGATSFNVSIKEYEDLVKRHKEAITKAEADYKKKIKSLEYEYLDYQSPKDYADRIWNQHIKEGWTDKKRLDENYYANHKQAQDKQKELEKRKAKEADAHKKKTDGIKNEIKKIDDLFKDVVWIYQLAGNNLPQVVNENSFNEAIEKGRDSINASINDLDTGGGFVYVQPYIYNKGYIPEINLQNGAIYFKYSDNKPEIKGAGWYKDNEGKEEITTPVKYGSTVYLLIKTKDLYGQLVTIEFKDDDSYTSKDEKNSTDDDLGIYPETALRNDYKVNNDIPATIKKDTQLQRMVSTFEWKTPPSNVVSGTLNVSDANKHDGKSSSAKAFQGALFAVYIDPFWSKEANVGIDESEIEVFPTVSRSGVETAVLKSATLKVSNEGTLINPSIDRSNKPLLMGEVDANFANFYPCRYDLVKGGYAKKANRDSNEFSEVIIFDSKQNASSQSQKLSMSVIAGVREARREVKITLDARTDECRFENDKSKNHKGKVIDLSLISDAIVIEESTRVNEHLVFDNKDGKPIKIKNISFSKEEEGHEDTNDDNEIAASHSKQSIKSGGLIGASRSSKATIYKDKQKIGRYPNSDNEVVLDIGFNYGSESVASLLKYIWPLRQSGVQHYPIILQTCCFTKQLDIQVYPDIKWILQFAYDCDPEEFQEMRKEKYDEYLVRVEKLDEKTKPKEIDEKIEKIDEDLANAKEGLRDAKGKKKAQYSKLIAKLEARKAKQKAIKVKYNKQKAKAKKEYKKNRPDLFSFKDNVSSGLSDMVVSLHAEYDRPGESIEVSASYQKYIALAKQLVEVTKMIELILNGKKKSKKKLEKKFKEINEDIAKKNLAALGDALKGRPLFSFDIIPPSLAILGSWYAEAPKDVNTSQVGIMGGIAIQAKPLIGASIMMDFLALAQKAHPIARGIITLIDVGAAVGMAPKITIELEVSGQLEIEGKLTYNSASGHTNLNQGALAQDKEDDSPLTVSGVFGVKLTGSVIYSKKIETFIFGSVEGMVSAEIEIKSGFTLSGAIKADEKGFYIDPLLTFHGVTVQGSLTIGYIAKNYAGDEMASGDASTEFELVLIHEYEGSFQDENDKEIVFYLT